VTARIGFRQLDRHWGTGHIRYGREVPLPHRVGSTRFGRASQSPPKRASTRPLPARQTRDKCRTSRSVSGVRTMLPQPQRTGMLTTRFRRAEHHTLPTPAGRDPLSPKARDTWQLDDESPNRPKPHRHRPDTTETPPRGASNSAMMLPPPRFAPLEPNRCWKRSNHRTSTSFRVTPSTDEDGPLEPLPPTTRCLANGPGGLASAVHIGRTRHTPLHCDRLRTTRPRSVHGTTRMRRLR
jgi:hypothetical protein